MTTSELAEALVAWAAEVCGIDSTYDHEPKQRTAPLPDAMSIIRSVAHAERPNDQAIQQLEQTKLKLSEASIVLVANPEPPDEAAETLNGFCDALGIAADDDPTLGGRVADIHSTFTFDFHPDAPFVEFDDGTRGRRMTMALTVIEHIGA